MKTNTSVEKVREEFQKVVKENWNIEYSLNRLVIELSPTGAGTASVDFIEFVWQFIEQALAQQKLELKREITPLLNDLTSVTDNQRHNKAVLKLLNYFNRLK